MQRTDFIRNCFSKRAIALWNILPKAFELKMCTYVTAKQKAKQHFLVRFQKDFQT